MRRSPADPAHRDTGSADQGSADLCQSHRRGDHSAELNADAKRILIDAELRLEIDQSTFNAAKRVAFRAAEEAVADNPQIWQKGRERARVVLGAIRDALPSDRRGAFPVDLSRIVADAPAEKLRDLKLAIPDELRALIELMVEP
jgi:hypothetical protein